MGVMAESEQPIRAETRVGSGDRDKDDSSSRWECGTECGTEFGEEGGGSPPNFSRLKSASMESESGEERRFGLLEKAGLILALASMALCYFYKEHAASYGEFVLAKVPSSYMAIPATFFMYYFVDWMSGSVLTWCQELGMDMTVSALIKGIVKYSAIITAMIMILGTFGVDTNSLTACLTSVGLAVGLASQKVLGNLAAGLMLLIHRHFKEGDYVVLAGGRAGTVKAIFLFDTAIDTPGNVRIMIPNSEVYESLVEVVTRHRMRRMDVEYTTAASCGIAPARAAVEASIEKYKKLWSQEIHARKELRRTHQHSAQLSDMGVDPHGKAPPQVVLTEITPLGYKWKAIVWSPTSNYMANLYALTEDIANALSEAGVKTAAEAFEGTGLPMTSRLQSGGI